MPYCWISGRSSTALRFLPCSSTSRQLGRFMPIEIFKGFVSDYVEGTRRSAAVSFSVGEPPVRFYSPQLLDAVPPFSVGDYVAVAGKRTFVPGVTHVALAYRRLGDMGSAHFMAVSLPGVCILCGLVGASAVAFLGPLDTATKVFVAALLTVGSFGVWRLWSMRQACRMLDQIESPLSTYSQRG